MKTMKIFSLKTFHIFDIIVNLHTPLLLYSILVAGPQIIMHVAICEM